MDEMWEILQEIEVAENQITELLAGLQVGQRMSWPRYWDLIDARRRLFWARERAKQVALTRVTASAMAREGAAVE